MTVPTRIRSNSLLPPNATDFELAIEDSLRANVDLSAVGNLWNPKTAPAQVLPFLAWGLSISQWDSEWTEQQKRDAIADAVPFHRRKGTRGIVIEVMERFHPLLQLVEWWQMNPKGAPYTFEVRAPASDIPASFLTQEIADAIIRDVASVKPARAHFTFVQSLEAQAAAYLTNSSSVGIFTRSDYSAAHDNDAAWDTYLMSNHGEPIQHENNNFLEV